jgi:hypothetical protein
MALLTSTQKDRVMELIELHHGALVVELLGKGAVSKSLLGRIRRAGLYRKPRHNIIRRAFQFGQQSVIDSRVLRLSDDEFALYLDRKGIFLDAGAKEAVHLLRRSLAENVRTLVTTMTSKVGQSFLKADKFLQRQLAQRQRRALFYEIERRKALASIAKDMSEIAGQQLGNASRTIITETNNAYQEGRAGEILRKAGGGDPECFKRPRHDACDDCKAAYLEEGGVIPRVFKMSALIENGSNIGKSKHDRQPVIDSFHPYCACELQWLPPGFGFDAKGQMVYIGVEKSA